MQLEARKYVFDIERAARAIASFTAGKTLDDYLADPLLRSGVERQFEIAGEAVNKLAKFSLETAQKITDYRKLIAFRNVLIHGYAEVDDRLVWDLVQSKLPHLLADLAALEGA
jgi:uncharacterized protein with HEPN domain